jgi:hypothetical protein
MIYDNRFTSSTRLTPPGNDPVLRPPALLSVEIEEGEDVEWEWTHLVGGRSVATGYRIVSDKRRFNNIERSSIDERAHG